MSKKSKYQKVEKEAKEKVVEQPVVEVKEEVIDLKQIEKERNKLICEIRSRVLTKSRVLRGGSDVALCRVREQNCWNPVILQINDLGKQLEKRIVALEDLRGA